MYRVQRHAGVGCGALGGEVKHAAPPDRRHLMPVSSQGHTHVVFIGDGEQRPGGVLVEHSCLVHEQHVALAECRLLAGAVEQHARVWAELVRGKSRPGAIVLPSVAVLVGQPAAENACEASS